METHPGAEWGSQYEKRVQLGHTWTDEGNRMPSAHYSRVKQAASLMAERGTSGTVLQPWGRPGSHRQGLRARFLLPPSPRRLPGGQAESCWLQPHHAYCPGHSEVPG